MFRSLARRSALAVPLGAVLAGAGLAVLVWWIGVFGWLW
jgi:hypothetical protein